MDYSEMSLREKNEALVERCLDFASDVLDVCEQFPRGRIPAAVALQVARSSASVGANLEEAIGAYSRPDFAHSANISKREARESRFWLRLAKRRNWNSSGAIDRLIGEAEELIRILTSIVKKVRPRDDVQRKDEI